MPTRINTRNRSLTFANRTVGFNRLEHFPHRAFSIHIKISNLTFPSLLIAGTLISEHCTRLELPAHPIAIYVIMWSKRRLGAIQASFPLGAGKQPNDWHDHTDGRKRRRLWGALSPDRILTYHLCNPKCYFDFVQSFVRFIDHVKTPALGFGMFTDRVDAAV
jgi:hypothetical protein